MKKLLTSIFILTLFWGFSIELSAQKKPKRAAQMCERLVPHLNEAGIDAMFCGHIHKWRVAEPDGSLSNAEFPVICNPNLQRMEVTATKNALHVNTFDRNGANTYNHIVNLK